MIMNDISAIPSFKKLTGSKSIIKVERHWDNESKDDETRRKPEIRYDLSSLNKFDNIPKYIRDHWSIENHRHWVLDVRFGEDSSTVRDKNAVKNMNTLKKIH